MKHFLTLLALIFSLDILAGIYVVNVKQAQLYSSPDANAEVIANVPYGAQVKVLSVEGDWMQVKALRQKGWVHSNYIAEVPEWKKVRLRTGDAPSKYAVKPVYDKSVDNFLEIQTSSSTEAIVKLMKMSSEQVSFADTCVRVAYISAGTTYKMKNIPLGRYYVKVAYGRDYSRTVIDGVEHEGFRRYPIFELIQDKYEFSVTKTPLEDGNISMLISTFQISLGLEIAEDEDDEDDDPQSVALNSSLISEEVFNK